MQLVVVVVPALFYWPALHPACWLVVVRAQPLSFRVAVGGPLAVCVPEFRWLVFVVLVLGAPVFLGVQVALGVPLCWVDLGRLWCGRGVVMWCWIAIVQTSVLAEGVPHVACGSACFALGVLLPVSCGQPLPCVGWWPDGSRWGGMVALVDLLRFPPPPVVCLPCRNVAVLMGRRRGRRARAPICIATCVVCAVELVQPVVCCPGVPVGDCEGWDVCSWAFGGALLVALRLCLGAQGGRCFWRMWFTAGPHFDEGP